MPTCKEAKQLKANVVFFCMPLSLYNLSFYRAKKNFRNFPNQLLDTAAEGMETEDTKSCQHCSRLVNMSAAGRHRCRCCHPAGGDASSAAGQCETSTRNRQQFIHVQSHFRHHHHNTPLILVAFVLLCAATSFVDGKNRAEITSTRLYKCQIVQA